MTDCPARLWTGRDVWKKLLWLDRNLVVCVVETTLGIKRGIWPDWAMNRGGSLSQEVIMQKEDEVEDEG